MSETQLLARSLLGFDLLFQRVGGKGFMVGLVLHDLGGVRVVAANHE